jgi:hypothetical protein
VVPAPRAPADEARLSAQAARLAEDYDLDPRAARTAAEHIDAKMGEEDAVGLAQIVHEQAEAPAPPKAPPAKPEAETEAETETEAPPTKAATSDEEPGAVEPAPARTAADDEPDVATKITARSEELEAEIESASGADAERLGRQKDLVDGAAEIEDPALAAKVLAVAERESADPFAAELLGKLVRRASWDAEGPKMLEDALGRLEIARAQRIVTADADALGSAQAKRLADPAAKLDDPEQLAVLRNAVDQARMGMIADNEAELSPQAALAADNLGGQCGPTQGRVVEALFAVLGPEAAVHRISSHRRKGADATPEGERSLVSNDTDHFITVVEIGGRTYLVDPTFGQMLNAGMGADGVGARVLAQGGGAAIATGLVQDGFVELTPDVARTYGRALTGRDAEFTVADFKKSNTPEDTLGAAQVADEANAAAGRDEAAAAAYAELAKGGSVSGS